MEKRELLVALFLSGLFCISHAEKKPLDHTSFDSWKSVVNYPFSTGGEWGAYAVNPQEGDGILTFYSTKGSDKITIARGYRPSFSASGRWGVALIKPTYSQTKEAKKRGKKDFSLPQDSLAIVDLKEKRVLRIPRVVSYKIGEKGGDWIAYTSCDTTYISQKQLEDENSGFPMVVSHLNGDGKRVVKWVKDYNFSKDGSRLALSIKKVEGDTLSTDGVGVMFLPDTSYILIDRDKSFYSTPVFDETGDKLTYTSSVDTVKTGTKRAVVCYSDLRKPMVSPKEYALDFKNSEGKSLVPNQYTEPKFSYNGKRLIGGVAPVIAPHDTTRYDFETAELDIWRWDAPYTPPQEKKRLEEVKTLNYPVVIDLETGEAMLVTDNPLATVKAPDRWDGDYALILDPAEKMVSHQWNYFADVKVNVRNLKDGKLKEVGTCYTDDGNISPTGKYAVWFRDKNYYTADLSNGSVVNASEKVPTALWDDSNDRPSPAEPYGEVFWSEGDKELFVYDKYDIWMLDPTGKREPVCLTSGEGRKKDLRFRYLNTDKERRYISKGEDILLTVFDYKNKYNGLGLLKYTGKSVRPSVYVLNEYSYTQVEKARKASVYSWQRANFSESPDIWMCKGTDFVGARKLSDANPQMKDYRWGTAKLVKWTAYDGKESEGVLYVPDDIDPEKSYPMLCVFYETGSESLYRHFTMEPSWSWVNYPFYVSRGYVIFVPDIHYTAGEPGESCYNYVCSGAEEMCRRYPWIDKNRIGIDGQSWGGYQTAYLVTRTDMFACAGSGAPVSNMTSAFGGIRWESGDSRQAQYEMGQSRIGRNLWEAPELYIYNSPVFHANKVNTPLLIMHNDGDGAVPWYQGIELFMALRRLQKPVWMLQYNGEAHNIKQRKNRKDITIRLQQFFDHYLKGDPMPEWMKKGIPMIRKGEEMGY
ncbi:MAG: prolyl oligopeptidase family serine peptidase [Muribaculaceae bacterium]|nr:prolyl oligopeptidase family serine peptidase [Muribaculaceae bacterium]